MNNSLNNRINHLGKIKHRRNKRRKNKNLELIRKLKLYQKWHQKYNKLYLMFPKFPKLKNFLKNKKELTIKKTIIHNKIIIKSINLLYKIMNP